MNNFKYYYTLIGFTVKLKNLVGKVTIFEKDVKLSNY